MENVQLILTGRQRDETGEESIAEVCSEAAYYEKKSGFYVLYEEIPEGSGTPVKSRIKFKNSVLELTKRGDICTHMVFEAGTEWRTDYATPYGRLQMEIFTSLVDVSFQDNEISIRVEYALSCGGRPISDCVLTVFIKRRD